MKEYSERAEDITRCLSEVRNATELLMPKFEEDEEDFNEPGPSNRTTSQVNLFYLKLLLEELISILFFFNL